MSTLTLDYDICSSCGKKVEKNEAEYKGDKLFCSSCASNFMFGDDWGDETWEEFFEETGQ